MFVLSSRYEGFPNVLLEAMASGCAFIAFDCDTGPGEIIEDGVNGLLVNPGSIQELTNAIVRLFADTLLSEELGEVAKDVRIRFSEDKTMHQWLSFLR